MPHELLPIPPDIGEYIRYDPDTGSAVWLKGDAKARRAMAGSLNSKGYRRIGFRLHEYALTRIAWFLMTGENAPRLVDHKDNNPLNNRWDNLRLATYRDNSANSRPFGGSGMKGVTWHKKCCRWQASVGHKGKNYYLGLFDTREEAHAAYMVKATELFGEFARAK